MIVPQKKKDLHLYKILDLDRMPVERLLDILEKRVEEIEAEDFGKLDRILQKVYFDEVELPKDSRSNIRVNISLSVPLYMKELVHTLKQEKRLTNLSEEILGVLMLYFSRKYPKEWDELFR